MVYTATGEEPGLCAGAVVTVEENVIAGGFGSAVLEALGEAGCENVAVKTVGVDDAFIEHGTPDQLRKKWGVDAEGIAAACLELLRAREKEPRSASSP